MTTSESFDVCVVGSGAGGGTLSWSLAEAGVKVLCLEKGPYYTVKDFVYHDELLIQKRFFFAPDPELEPHMIDDRPGQPAQKSRNGWIANCVGGGTVHMSGFFYRLHRSDLTYKSRFGVPQGGTVEDWPISYEEFEPWYDRIEYLLGVTGVAGSNPFDEPRKVPYPNPPILHHPFTEPFDRAAKKLGWHAFPTPRAILSRPYAGRPTCNYCGYCGNFGCESGAKSSVLAAFIPRAEKTGNFTLRPKSMAYEVVAGADGRVTGVRYFDEHGASHEVKARVVVVSCTSIESARLLLNSKSKAFPNGLANGAGQVGKNLHFSTFAGVEADFHRSGGGKDFPGFDSRLPFLGRSVQDFYEPKKEHRAPVEKAGMVRFDMQPKPPIYRAGQVASPGDTRDVVWGKELKDRLRHHFHQNRSMEAEIFHEYTSNEQCFVSLDPEIKDKHGLSAARIQVRLLEKDVLGSRFLQDKAVELFEAMGADVVRRGAHGAPTYVLQHGTCRFGDDPQRSVLDRNCRAHEVPNLFVVDGSFMPSSGGVPTTLTIQANSLRVAAHIRDALMRRDL